jgi:hypothetical protein
MELFIFIYRDCSNLAQFGPCASEFGLPTGKASGCRGLKGKKKGAVVKRRRVSKFQKMSFNKIEPGIFAAAKTNCPKSP